MLDNNLESASAKINEALMETKTQMRIPYEQSVNTRTALEGIASKMKSLRDKLDPEPDTDSNHHQKQKGCSSCSNSSLRPGSLQMTSAQFVPLGNKNRL